MAPIKKIPPTVNTFKKLPDKFLLKNVRIIDLGEKIDDIMSVVIEKGNIASVLKNPPANFNGEIFESKDAIVFPGFFDMHTHLREPGREDEETIESGSLAAANGGFTGVACMPNTDPPIDSQEVVQYIKERSAGSLIDIYPVAAITKARQGKELAPIAELVEAGAVAISDDGTALMNSEMMRRALEYSKMFGIAVLGHEEDTELTKNRHMHEGFYSTKLGLAGMPAVAEEIMVARDIMLTEFTGGKLHICHISTRGSIDLVRQAKTRGLAITCEVTPHHFTLTDQSVESFDTNTKMNPPLRSADDRKAIIEGIKDGTIDAIATDHAPHSIEEKESEYICAPFGIIGLETAWGLISTMLLKPGVMSLNDVYYRCVFNPRRILNLEIPMIKQGQNANLTIVNSNYKWKPAEAKSLSKSINTPFNNYNLEGKSLAVINKGKIFYS
jgi:dihydroorotase